LNEAGTNCANQADGTTCVGHESVSRTTSSGVVSTTYVNGGDRANLATTHIVSSGEVDTETGDYGFNVLKPLSSTGTGLTYLVFGGSSLTNIGGAGQSIWQSIALSTTGNSAPCAGIPSFLLVQTPKGTTNAITLNGAPIIIGSTIYAHYLSTGELEICVLDGSITIGGVTINAGECVKGTLNANGTIDPGSFSAPYVNPPGSLAGVQALVEGVPANLLEYAPETVVVTCPSGVGAPSCTVNP
jgi:hypothetical protein